MANNNFVVQNGLTVGTTTIFAGNGDIVATGNITSTGSAPASFTSINNTPIGNVTPSTAAFTTVTMSSAGSIVPSANLAVNLGSPTAYFGTIYAGQHTANTVTATSLGGTLTTAGQPNVTTLAGLTSIGTSGVTTTAAGNFTITGCLTVNGTTTTINNTTIETTEYVTTINATNVYAGTIGNSGAVLYGTLNSSSASQPNITTLGGVTSIGASGSTTLTGILQTAAQTNITSVGTLTGLTVSGAIVPNSNVTVNLGSTSAWWNTIYGTAIHAQYADLAENYQGDRQYNPGTVLMFGGANEVTVADADTTRVAGVVSTNPAHLMNGALSGPNVVALALTGRVPCMVIGPVAKGDMMVSAGFGYAKVNNAPQCGQVIGKALEDFPILAKGVIEVVVGRF